MTNFNSLTPSSIAVLGPHIFLRDTRMTSFIRGPLQSRWQQNGTRSSFSSSFRLWWLMHTHSSDLSSPLRGGAGGSSGAVGGVSMVARCQGVHSGLPGLGLGVHLGPWIVSRSLEPLLPFPRLGASTTEKRAIRRIYVKKRHSNLRSVLSKVIFCGDVHFGRTAFCSKWTTECSFSPKTVFML